jgi:RNase P subunit RPR2
MAESIKCSKCQKVIVAVEHSKKVKVTGELVIVIFCSKCRNVTRVPIREY